jgi:hypothetical protein
MQSPSGTSVKKISRDDALSTLAVQQARSAATRSLLHDFSNVMVGLCSMSENAIDEIEPDNPLRDDMEIIRDSAFKARDLIRRISALNGADEEQSLVDLVSWMGEEVETIRTVLPRGSVVKIPDPVRTVLTNIPTGDLRDFLITLASGISGNAKPDHLEMAIDICENDKGCVIAITVKDIDNPEKDLAIPDEAVAPLLALSERLGATLDIEQKQGRLVRIGLTKRTEKV